MRRFPALAAALVVTACTDAVSPRALGPGGPRYATSPGGGIALDQFNSTMATMATGATLLQKGFNPVNPHNGATIVVTFLWSSADSTNIITGVRDYLTNGKPVGNTYSLVEFVSHGGMSMATYVATNVQNFPDAYDERVTPGDSILAVGADLSTPVTRAGEMITAFDGVQLTLADALGAHRSASGSASTVTPASPGPVAAGAGSAVYAVTMSKPPAGDDPPAGFTDITNISNDSLKADGEYAVQAAADTVNAQWNWYYSTTSPGSWVVSALVLNPQGATTSSGNLTVTTSTSGSNLDPDGYTATVDGASQAVGTNGSVTFAGLAAGDHAVTLSGVAANCTVGGSNPRTVTVPSGGTATTGFSVSCASTTVTPTRLAFTTQPSGVTAGSVISPAVQVTAQDSAGNTATSFTGTVAVAIGTNPGGGTLSGTTSVTAVNGVATFSNLSINQPGTGYTLTAAASGLSGATSAAFDVTASNQPPTANFTFSCSGLACGFTSTSSDPDGSIAGYSWSFGDGGSSTAQNPSHTYGAGGSYTVTLTVTDNQGAASSPVSKVVSVTAPNQPPTASFTVSCGGLTCSFTSTSSDPDGSIAGYSWTFGDGGSSTAANPSHAYAAGGSYTVTLRVTDNQGAVSAPVSQTVTVTAPNSPPVVNAGPDETAVLGVLYSTSFSFTDANNDGPWSYTIDWGDGSKTTGSSSTQGSFSASHTYVGLVTTYPVTITVTDSHGASGSDTKKVTVLLL